jgi:hypothetical protein
MGHTLSDWEQRVSLWLHDIPELDVSASSMIEQIALPAALAQYGQDRTPPPLVVELAGNGTGYYTLPGFDAETDAVIRVEFPGRQTPAEYLDAAMYGIGRDPLNVTLTKLVLLGVTPAASQWLRVTYTSTAGPPFPTEDPTTDTVPEGAFVFVCALAAAYCCIHLLAEASRDRQGSMPTDFAQGTDRATMLQATADRLTNLYRTFMGLPPVGSAGGVPESPSRPAYGRLAFSTGSRSLFHRG